MAEIELQNDIGIMVDNCGLITLIAKTGHVCLIHTHPADTTALVNFLVEHGYSFT